MFKYVIASVADTDIEIYKKCFELMTDERKQRILRFTHTGQQKLSILGEWLAKKLIAEETRSNMESIDFSRDDKGKPYSLKTSGIHFNISHCEDIAVAVISDKPVGIDIEKIRNINLKLTKRACTKEELRYIFDDIPTETDYEVSFPHPYYNRFWDVWTAKEAYFKCVGTGITNLKSVDTVNLQNKEKIVYKDYIIHIIQETP